MADYRYQRPVEASHLPWFTFLFLAAIFFFVHHDLTYSTRFIDNYNGSEDEIIAGVIEGSLVHRIALLSLGLFAIVSLSRHRADRRLQINGSLGWILLSFAAWVLISPLWAEDLALTLRRLAAFAILCIASVAIARRLSLREIVFWTFFSTSFFLAIGLSAEIFLRTFRPFAPGYRFAGTLHPNVQGVNCALLLLSGVAAADLQKHWQTILRVCALLGAVFLILTGSRTAFAAAILSLVVYFAFVCSKRVKIAVVYALSIVLCVLLLFLANTSLPGLKRAAMLGREDSGDESFNGRAGVWEEVGRYVQRRPLLGYGYGGFWNEVHIAEISADTHWGVSGAHSAYLDCVLEVGLIGLFVYALALVVGIGRAFRFHGLSRDSAFAFCGALLIFCLSDGLLESVVVTPTFLMFLSMVAVTRLAYIPTPGEQQCVFTQMGRPIYGRSLSI